MTKRTRTQPRKSPRQARSTATVSIILESAARILARDGYEKSSVNFIAEHAGVSVGSLYQYFPSKDALVVAVMKRHSEQMIETFQRDLVELAGLPVPQAVRGIVERTLQAYALDPALRRVMIAEEPKFGALARSREFFEMLHELFKAYLIFHGDALRPKNVDLAVRILMTAVEAVGATMMLQTPEHPYDPQEQAELADELTILVLRYLERRD